MVSDAVTGYARRPCPDYVVIDVVRIIDVIIIVALSVGVAAIHPGWPGDEGLFASDPSYLSAGIVGAVITLIVYQLGGFYGPAEIYAASPAYGRLALLTVLVFGILLFLWFAQKSTAQYSRIWTVSWMIATVAAQLAHRWALARVLSAMARDGAFGSRMVFFGGGADGRRLYEYLTEHADPRHRLLGYFDDRIERVEVDRACPRLGTMSDLIRMARDEMIDEVLIALPGHAEQRILELINQLSVLPVRVSLAPVLAAYGFAGRQVSELAGLPVLHVQERPIAGRALLAKRLSDKILAVAFLLVALPLMAIIAVAIKLESEGPVFFRQKRLGFNDRQIEILKFRTMRQDLCEQDEIRQATKNDARITKVGRFLRRWSLDEVPQLINVLRGDMSMVGPRPHAPSTRAEGLLFQEAVADYAVRHKVKPGITGWAQVNGLRGETDELRKIRKRVEYDLYYIEHWSFWLDLRIILMTGTVVFRGENAY